MGRRMRKSWRDANSKSRLLLPLRPGVAWLVHAQLAPARQAHLGEQAPAFVGDRRARDAALLQLLEEGADVGAHEIDLVSAAGSRFMHRELGRRNGVNEKTASAVDARQLKHLAEESAVRLDIAAENHHVCAGQHSSSS